jgi:nitronate monooxygenase
LVAAVSNAGALGSLAAPLLSPKDILQQAAEIRRLTERPYAINLFVGGYGTAEPDEIRGAIERLRPYRDALGLPEPAPPNRYAEDMAAQIAAVIEARPPVFSFTFGIAPADALAACRERGIVTVGTATTADEAVALEKAGVDVVVAQGGEAGGHRGTFLGRFEDSMIGTMALVPQVRRLVSCPVVAAGGIMNGDSVAAAFRLGADAAQLGTAFLCCDESGIPSAYKTALQSDMAKRTAVTRAFSGRPARGLVNRFMEEMGEVKVPTYPVQNALTQEIRRAAAKAGRAEFLSLWAGQGAPLIRPMSAGRLVDVLRAELASAPATP